jgi:hypothetical protein
MMVLSGVVLQAILKSCVTEAAFQRRGKGRRVGIGPPDVVCRPTVLTRPEAMISSLSAIRRTAVDTWGAIGRETRRGMLGNRDVDMITLYGLQTQAAPLLAGVLLLKGLGLDGTCGSLPNCGYRDLAQSHVLNVIWTPMEEILNFGLVQAPSRSYR